MEFIPLIVLYTLLSLIFLSYSIYSFKNSNNRLILNFAFINLAIFIFSFGKIGELLSNSYEIVYSSTIIQCFGLTFLSIFLFRFAYKFRYNKYPSINKTVHISIVPFISLFLVITNNIHHLYYKKIELISYKGYFILNSAKGIFYYIFLLNLYLILVFSIYALFFAYKHNTCNFKKQSKLILIGLMFPLILSVFFLTGSNQTNPVLIGFFIMNIFSFKALFKYNFLDLKETVREHYIDKITEGILVIDNFNRIIDFNREASILLPFLSSNYLGNPITDYETGKKIMEVDNSCFFEFQVIFKESIKIYEFRKVPITSKGKITAHAYIFSDKTTIKNLVSNLYNLANHDFLTGISNRMNFLKLAESELNRIKRYKGEFSIVMIDIDYFKKINDTYGHSAGDEVIKGLTNLIKNNLRVTDIFGRLGGEEFSIIFPETSINNGKKKCEKIRGLVENTPILVNDLEINISISIGMTYYNNEMTEVPIELIIDLADRAMYTAKRLGRNRVMYNHFSLRY